MQCLRLEEVNSTDPNALWDYIRRLGPNKKSKIPWECYDDNDVVVDDPERVLKSWRDEFGSLYCSTTPSEIDDEQINFKQYIVNDNKEYEILPLDNSSYINQPFSRDEISKVVGQSKTNKASGIDGIVYGVLKTSLPQICWPHFSISVLKPIEFPKSGYKLWYILSRKPLLMTHVSP